jgi:hypothetical protein
MRRREQSATAELASGEEVRSSFDQLSRSDGSIRVWLAERERSQVKSSESQVNLK